MLIEHTFTLHARIYSFITRLNFFFVFRGRRKCWKWDRLDLINSLDENSIWKINKQIKSNSCAKLWKNPTHVHLLIYSTHFQTKNLKTSSLIFKFNRRNFKYFLDCVNSKSLHRTVQPFSSLQLWNFLCMRIHLRGFFPFKRGISQHSLCLARWNDFRGAKEISNLHSLLIFRVESKPH